MSNSPYHPAAKLLGALLFASIGFCLLAADAPPPPPKVSSFAPAPQLEKQVDYYLGRIKTALESKEGYDEGKQGRVRGDANLLIVLLMSLGLHDADNPLKPSAAGLAALSQLLVDNFQDYDGAKAVYDNLAKARKEGIAGPPLTWEKRYKLGLLMKQVTAINGQLRRSVKANKFNDDADKVAGYATVMAVIGQATLIDTHEVKNPDQLGDWYRLSAEFRDAAGALGAAASAKDFKAAEQAMKRMTTSCDDCHAIFRKEAM